jgi:hypothetical protein
MNNSKKIRMLIELLDDESQLTASFVMAELLKFSEELPMILREYQESDNLLIRKRIHQLENIYKLQRKRAAIAEKISNNTDIFDTLIELHSQWYDSDTPQTIKSVWEAILLNAQKHQLDNTEKLAYFLQKYGLRTSNRGEIQADLFCIGIVLEELIGNNIVICSIAQKISIELNFPLQFIMANDEFALLDKEDNILLPQQNWQISNIKDYNKIVYVENKKVIEYCTLMLFLSAIITDSFRYINTLGHIISSAYGEESLKHLPYPYNTENP